MSGFVEGENRYQATLFPEHLDDYVHEESPVQVIDLFIDELDISGLGFKTEPAETGRPARMLAAPDQQISLTDPDARSMATSCRCTGIVGYNVQTVVDAKHHLIVAHEVTNQGHDRTQLLWDGRHGTYLKELDAR